MAGSRSPALSAVAASSGAPAQQAQSNRERPLRSRSSARAPWRKSHLTTSSCRGRGFAKAPRAAQTTRPFGGHWPRLRSPGAKASKSSNWPAHAARGAQRWCRGTPNSNAAAIRSPKSPWSSSGAPASAPPSQTARRPVATASTTSSRLAQANGDSGSLPRSPARPYCPTSCSNEAPAARPPPSARASSARARVQRTTVTRRPKGGACSAACSGSGGKLRAPPRSFTAEPAEEASDPKKWRS
mmetsp:Transcript_22031/g.63532  ORF Transcript_22031/g.63532 Transcript_22031/m.63532 type:complete len:242 (-) Transcript_22031:345-1070(-)